MMILGIMRIRIHWCFFFLKNFILTTCHQFLPKLIQREIKIWEVTFENVYLLCTHSSRFVQPCLYRLEVLLRCAMLIYPMSLWYGESLTFFTFCFMLRLLWTISVIKIIMEFCWILFSHYRMMYTWLCFCMFHQPKVTYLLITKSNLKILLMTYR